jgi:hypothetical protein
VPRSPPPVARKPPTRASPWTRPRARSLGPWHRRRLRNLAKDKAVDYVINYSMVDSDADAAISEEEFKKGCAGGWIKASRT